MDGIADIVAENDWIPGHHVVGNNQVRSLDTFEQVQVLRLEPVEPAQGRPEHDPQNVMKPAIRPGVAPSMSSHGHPPKDETMIDRIESPSNVVENGESFLPIVRGAFDDAVGIKGVCRTGVDCRETAHPGSTFQHRANRKRYKLDDCADAVESPVSRDPLLRLRYVRRVQPVAVRSLLLSIRRDRCCRGR